MTELAQRVAPAGERIAPRRPEDVIAAVAALHDLVDSYGAENDEKGFVAEPVIQALYDCGAMGVITPRELGGSEMTPRQAMDVYRTLSYADPSTGWVVMALAMSTGLAGAFFTEEAAAELFSTPRLGIAGQGTRAGRAEPVEGGYLVSGQWSFASGIKHATHLHTAAADTTTGETRFFIVPVAQVDFVDNWDVLGLHATGSIDYTLDGVFVRTEFSYPSLSTAPTTGGWLYRVGIGNFASMNHGAWAIGVGRRLLDELASSVQRKSGRSGSWGDNASFHEQYARAELRLRSAEALLYGTWAEIEAVLARGDRMSVRLETLNRAALCNATDALDDVAGFVYRSAGSEALRPGVIQRLYRDVHGGTQHISSSPVVLQSAGRQLAGLAEGQKWVHFQLV
ncbi:MAG: acyl-CoA dehydrogenase family protein [Herbiconiux sp.]|nr:acyl-CoA dehydrogenase family protein [Herbiconiux sp.]